LYVWLLKAAVSQPAKYHSGGHPHRKMAEQLTGQFNNQLTGPRASGRAQELFLAGSTRLESIRRLPHVRLPLQPTTPH